MLLHVKDRNTLIVNTMINDVEKPELLEFLNNLNHVKFDKLYDINGNVSGVAFYKSDSDIAILDIYRESSVILSFELTDDDGNPIAYEDVSSISLKCTKNSELIFEKLLEDFRYEDGKFKVDLSSQDTNLPIGDYDLTLECSTVEYSDAVEFILKILRSGL